MSTPERITLYAAVDSPFPHRVLLALEEAKASYDIIWIDLLNKQEWYEKKVYPNGAKVPYLIYGGPKLHEDEAPSPEAVRIPESIAILEFLNDIFPDARLLPADPVLRAKARLFYQAVDATFISAFVGFLFMGEPVDKLLAVIETLQGMLPPTGFAVGEWSIADASFIPFMLRLEMTLGLNPPTLAEGVAVRTLEILHSPRFARLQKWVEDNVARPSMAKTWNEPAVITKFHQRIDRMRKTGIINSEMRVPVQPSQ